LIDRSPNIIELGKWKFHKIEITDLALFSKHIKATQYPANLWFSNFAYLWSISQSSIRKVLWKIVDNMLVTFVHSDKDTLYICCLPFGKANPEKVTRVLKKCTQYCYNWNKQDKSRTMIKMINSDQLDFLRRCPEFDKTFRLVNWKGIERHNDIKKLVALEGSEFSDIRNRISKFHRDNPNAVISEFSNKEIGLGAMQNGMKSEFVFFCQDTNEASHVLSKILDSNSVALVKTSMMTSNADIIKKITIK